MAQKASFWVRIHYRRGLFMKISSRLVLYILSILLFPSLAAADTWLDYLPLNNKWAAALWSTNGLNGSFTGARSQFAITPVTSERGDVYGGDVQWGLPTNWNAPTDDIEEWGLKPGCSSRHPYVWLYAYRENSGERYAIRTLRYEYVDINANQTFVATTDCETLPDGTLDGQPYAIFNVYSAPYKMKLWMVILDNNGNPDKRVYWEHTITHIPSVYNSCWEVNATKTRAALKQTEAWWEITPSLGQTAGQWIIGGGGTPFDSNLNPVNPGTVWHGRLNYFGKNAGAGWLGASLDQNGQPFDYYCMRYGWYW
jgi:hypothetical protein